MKKYILFIVISSGLILTACQSKEAGIKPVVRNMTEAIYASGNIYPLNDYKISNIGDGYLVQSYVSEGDLIKKGQLLFKIESETQNIRQNTSRDIYLKALENYSENSPILKEQKILLENSLAKFKNDSINYERYKKLKSSNAIAQSEFDKIELAYTLSTNDLNSRQQSYEKVKNQLYTELKNAENQYKVSNKDASNYIIKSAIDGKIYEITPKIGDLIRRNEILGIAGSDKVFYIKLSVDELDIKKIKLGQEVWITADVEKGKIFKAEISKIYPKLTKETQSFRVDASFKEPFPLAMYGLNVEANIIVQQKNNVLTIPKTYVYGNDSVMVETKGQTNAIKINKGIEDFDYVEVVSGLDSNSIVLKK